MVSVPWTLTRAPRAGSAAQNGNWSAARWMMRVTPRCRAVASSSCRSLMSPITASSRANSAADSTRASRSRVSSALKSVTASPSASSWRVTQAPMQPVPPVTRKFSLAMSGDAAVGDDGHGAVHGAQLRLQPLVGLARPPRRGVSGALPAEDHLVAQRALRLAQQQALDQPGHVLHRWPVLFAKEAFEVGGSLRPDIE